MTQKATYHKNRLLQYQIFTIKFQLSQLDPTKEKVYDLLEMIYREFYDMFDFDSFHMGADEVHLGCWNSSSNIAEYMQNDLRMKDRDEQCRSRSFHVLLCLTT